MVCTAIASAAFALVTYAWRVIDAGDRAAREAAIDALERRLRESRDKLARLPRLREAARLQPAQPGAAIRPAGGDWRAVADLASRAGVTLRSLAPASAAAASRVRGRVHAARALRVDGQADFSGLYAFLSGLSTLPMLVVPQAVDIQRDKGTLVFGATLDVFDLPPAQAEPAIHAPAQAGGDIADPFGGGGAQSQLDAAVGRLVGVVHDSRRALALFEAASGPRSVVAAPGQMLGADRLVGIDAAGVTLVSRAGTRRVPLSEGGR
ncbi:hypothetical protein [Trinickia dinghuensis]|uniref:Uncharacterized protein n=1 Tax=Trinickia dinghuensis TaxID=2291023 RepID=A0A3D8JS93_9BURK|nr:hypothetical protein [Trinickia dinghuensis]RDU95546.1 hypothetical protein DWV00_28705 [Trinickia dinghuensis]